MSRDRLGFMADLDERYGDAMVFPLAGRRIYFVNRPDLVAHVLVKAEDRYVKGIGLTDADEVRCCLLYLVILYEGKRFTARPGSAIT